jgi:predicted transposase/invertase (TIGR01784 family)
MQFIDVRTDFAFKKVFGSKQSKDILISFLNAILDFDGMPIVDLTIVDPYQAPPQNMKKIDVDAKASLEDGTVVLIEIQVLNFTAMKKRGQYNLTKAYSAQLNEGESYTHLKPVIALTITDFEMFETGTEVISDFRVLEKTRFELYSKEMALVFIELPKFNKKATNLTSITDKWIYFLKNAGSLKYIPKTLAHEQAINNAFSIANMASLTAKELDIQEKKLRWVADQKELLERVEAAEEALALEKAEKQAAAKAAKEAERKAAKAAIDAAKEANKSAILQMAKQMLQANADIAFVMQVTGLNKTAIKKLKSEL